VFQCDRVGCGLSSTPKDALLATAPLTLTVAGPGTVPNPNGGDDYLLPYVNQQFILHDEPLNGHARYALDPSDPAYGGATLYWVEERADTMNDKEARWVIDTNWDNSDGYYMMTPSSIGQAAIGRSMRSSEYLSVDIAPRPGVSIWTSAALGKFVLTLVVFYVER
jgi:hypothetical protein